MSLSQYWNLHNFQYQIVELKRMMVMEIWLVNKEVVRHVFSGLLPKHRIFTMLLMISTLRCQKLVILVICSACLMLQKLWAFYLSTFLGDEKQALLEECVESFNRDAVENGIKTIYL